MAPVGILVKRNINSLTKKIFYWRMPTGIRIVEVFKKLLSIAYWRKEKNKTLASSGLIFKKSQGALKLRELVMEP